MFTGIISTLGRVDQVNDEQGSVELVISSTGFFDESKLGDSVAINGVCLTITELGENSAKVFSQVETNSKTTTASLQTGDQVNLEHPLRLSDRLGGHLVQGHVDGVVEMLSRKENLDGSVKLEFSISAELSKFVALHGSVCVNGVSLTVSDKTEKSFSVALIPSTLENTTLEKMRVGDISNIEVDCLARYVEQLMAK
ncbi:MAG TPA: riboflavin synthase [Acidimicrobiia bacterium]|nr:riboflavin synthase [Acidimicrobiia bacterium]